MKIKIKNLWAWIAGQTAMIWLWIKNFYFVFISTEDRPRVFEGYGHYWLAKKYADIRTKRTSKNKCAGRKRHFVLPFGDYSLIVLNRLEINNAKSKRIISKNFNIVSALKNAYYISK